MFQYGILKYQLIHFSNIEHNHVLYITLLMPLPEMIHMLCHVCLGYKERKYVSLGSKAQLIV